MSDRSIVKIELSDSDDRFRMKCNANFQQLSMGAKADGAFRSIVLDTIGGDMSAIINAAFDAVYPIGAGIWTNTLNDSRLERGRWRQVSDRFVLAAGERYPQGSTGGSETVILTKQQMPAHNHSASSTAVPEHTHTVEVASNGAHVHAASSGTQAAHSHTASSGSSGSHAHGASSNNTGAHTHGASSNSTGSHAHNENARNDLWAYGEDGKKAAIGSAPGWEDDFYTTKTAGQHSHSITVNSAGNHAHTITVNEAGAHSHSVTVNNAGSHAHTVTVNSAGAHAHTATVSKAASQTPSVSIGSEGGGLAHDNMPPYFARFYFERIA